MSQKKTRHYNIVHNFAICWPIFKLLSVTDSLVNLQWMELVDAVCLQRSQWGLVPGSVWSSLRVARPADSRLAAMRHQLQRPVLRSSSDLSLEPATPTLHTFNCLTIYVSVADLGRVAPGGGRPGGQNACSLKMCAKFVNVGHRVSKKLFSFWNYAPDPRRRCRYPSNRISVTGPPGSEAWPPHV